MKSIIISIIIAAVFIGGAIFLAGNNSGNDSGELQNRDNVTITDGKQIIDISAKGGYEPRKSVAKAGIPTVLRVSTNGTFDCSASIRLPSLKVYKTLTSTGVTEFDLGTQPVGIFRGSCGMGMYRFEIDFTEA